MYRIVIADDENIVRERLLSLLEKLSVDFEVVGSFDNGFDALEGVEKLQPDLLITDIKMPYIDGLELIKQARIELPLLQTIIISGYDSFEYAKQAIDLKVMGYLSKPISFEELKEVLYRAKKEIEKKAIIDKNEIELEKETKKNLSLIQGSDLSILIQLKTFSDNFKNKLENDGIDLTYKYQFILVFDNDQEADTLSYEKNEAFRVLVLKYFEEEFKGVFKYYNFILDSKFVVICETNAKPSKEIVADKIKTILAKLLKIANLSVSCGVSNLMEQHEVNYRKMYRHALKCLEYRTIIGKNIVMIFDDFEKEQTIKIGKVDENEYKVISYEILYGKKDEVKAKVHKIIDQISSQNYKDSYDLILGNILDAVLKSCVDLTRFYKEYMGHVELINKMYTLKTLESVNDFFNELIDEVTKINEENRIGGVQSSFEQIKKYIDKNYAISTLCLEDVANELSYSISYISAIFKKNNTSFTKYLTDIRMKQAKILISEGNNKLITIASAVGYEDPYYFSHCFKKYYGVSPLEYKNTIK